MTRIVVLGQHLAVAGAVAELLSDEVDHASPLLIGPTVTSRLLQHVPDVIVLHVEEPDPAMLAALLETTRLPVVVAAPYHGRRTRPLLSMGIAAWVPPSLHAERLRDVVRSAAEGECFLPPDLLFEALHPRRADAAEPDLLAALTARELQVLQLMVDGADRSTIAARLGVSLSTVGTHVSRVLGKTGARDRLQAVARAHQAGLRPRPGSEAWCGSGSGR